MFYVIIVIFINICNTHFFNRVNAQPSTTISCVADKKLITNTTIRIIFIFGFPFSGNQSSMLFPKYINNKPV